MLTVAPNPYTALETYAEFMGRLHTARTSSILNGWRNWFFTYEHVTEDEVLRNAEFAARTLKPLGLEYIQVDEGFQRWHGEWEGERPVSARHAAGPTLAGSGENVAGV